MYIYHALINALSAHMIHINLNMIFYAHMKDPGHSATRAGGRLQLNTHAPYVCGDLVHGCMVYTELAPRRQQFHAAPAMPAL